MNLNICFYYEQIIVRVHLVYMEAVPTDIFSMYVHVTQDTRELTVIQVGDSLVFVTV